MKKNIIKKYLSQPIIRLLLFQIIIIIFINLVYFFGDIIYTEKFELPGQEQVVNNQNKKKMANLISRELLLINIKFKSILLSNNYRQIDNLSREIDKSFSLINTAIPLFKTGGTLTDHYSVNFSTVDEITEKIVFKAPESGRLSIEIIDIEPKIYDLQQMIKSSQKHVLKNIAEDKNLKNFGDELLLIMKKTDTLFIRIMESSNKIYNDIIEDNLKSQHRIDETRIIAKKVIVTINGALLIYLIIFILFI